MRVTLSALLLLISHHALALPTILAEPSELKAYPIASVEVPNENATLQTLQPRQVAAWSSTPMNGLVSILFTPAAASTLSIANAWLSWKFALIYSQDVNSKVSWSGTVYSDNGESGSDLSLCVGDYTPASTGTTEGIPWTEGTVDFDGTWRSLATGNMVTMIFSLSCRFYQTAAPGLAIASAASEIVKGPTGFQVNQATQWQCTLQPPGTVTPITIVGSVVENWC